MRAAPLALIVACGNPKPIVHTTADNLCDQIAAVTCYDMLQCCDDAALEQLLGVTGVPSHDSCVATLTMRCKLATAPEQLSLANERVEFDSAAADACLDALVAPDDACTTPAGVPPWADACRVPFWTGLVGELDICNTPLECASGLFCAGRTCEVVHSNTCVTSTECGPFLTCDNNTCVSRSDVGGSCTTGDNCRSGECDPGVCPSTGWACDSQCLTCRVSKHDCSQGQLCPTNDECVAAACTGGTGCVAVVANYCTGPLAALPLPLGP